MKNILKYLFAMAMAVAGTSAYAASGVIELEIPGMNYNEPDADGFIPLLGAASDLCVALTQVTNAAYALFDPSHTFNAGKEGHPVVNVSYEDAVRYCEWLTENSPGYAYKYRLPTQEEWELAADYKVLEADPDGDGFPTWAEYIALTNPNDAAIRFNATISIDVDGTPVVGWNTQTSPSRTYKVFGKVDLSDSVWLEVKDNVELYRFFRVTV